ncbi:MAG: cupin domain-containing protein [Candidatus Dormibacteraceae bacterium]
MEVVVAPLNLYALAAGLRDGTVEGQTVVVGEQSVRIHEVFTTEFTQAVLYVLRSGQTIPRHRHTGIDDVFLGILGEGRIRVWSAGGDVVDLELKPGSMKVITPGTVHEVVSDSDGFAYLLLQAPKEGYDLIPVESSA